jgi:hypothetical protein
VDKTWSNTGVRISSGVLYSPAENIYSFDAGARRIVQLSACMNVCRSNGAVHLTGRIPIDHYVTVAQDTTVKDVHRSNVPTVPVAQLRGRILCSGYACIVDNRRSGGVVGKRT